VIKAALRCVDAGFLGVILCWSAGLRDRRIEICASETIDGNLGTSWRIDCHKKSSSTLAAIEKRAVVHSERRPDPRRRKVAGRDARHRLENCKLMTPFVNPESDDGFDRRAAGDFAFDLRDHHGAGPQIKAFARPSSNVLSVMSVRRRRVRNAFHNCTA
jgi:hypothetical protein